MSVPFFDITRQNQKLRKELDHEIAEVVTSGRFILGETVSRLEKDVAEYCGTKFAVGVASGTDALHLALRACGIKEGDEVITTPFTFVATAEAIAYCGAKPVFADIELKSFNLDADKIEEKITAKTKAILPVHLYGNACEMQKMSRLCEKTDIKMIEDCAQAIGAEYDGRKVGAFGDAGCFSFFPTKNLGCFGDGGMITTNDAKIHDELIALRNHGSRITYHYDMIGHNSRLDAIQAAVIGVKLPHLNEYSEKRRKNAQIYMENLNDITEITLPSSTAGTVHVYNQFTIYAKRRDDLFGFLRNRGIGAMVYYPLSLHLQKAFISLGHKKGDFPVCEQAQEEVLSLPIFPEIGENELQEVCAAIKEFYRK